MAWWSALLGGGGGSLVGAVGKIIDDVHTSDEERAAATRLQTELEQIPALAQVTLNTAEAQHRTLFVAGWRPFIGWVCGAGLGYHFLAHPLLTWGLKILAPEVEAPPALEVGLLLDLVLAMLGLAGMRSWEKNKGVTK